MSAIAFAVGVVTYLESEAAMNFDSEWVNDAGTISQLLYEINSYTKIYRITNIGLSFMLGISFH